MNINIHSSYIMMHTYIYYIIISYPHERGLRVADPGHSLQASIETPASDGVWLSKGLRQVDCVYMYIHIYTYIYI